MDDENAYKLFKRIFDDKQFYNNLIHTLFVWKQIHKVRIYIRQIFVIREHYGSLEQINIFRLLIPLTCITFTNNPQQTAEYRIFAWVYLFLKHDKKVTWILTG